MTDNAKKNSSVSMPFLLSIGEIFRSWREPRAQNRGEMFRERTVRTTLLFFIFFISLSLLASIFIFRDPWDVVSFPTVHIFMLILCVVSVYFVSRSEILYASYMLIIAIYVGAIGLHLIARQESSVLRLFTGIPTFMFPPLAAALLFPRKTILPLSVLSVVLYILTELVIPVPTAEPLALDPNGLVGITTILLLGEGVILSQLRIEFDDRLEALRVSVDLAEKSRLQAETERHRAEQADRAKSQFLANMSHELRTPLNAIIGYDEIMLGGMMGTFTDSQTRLLGNIQVNSRRLLALINDILDLSKIESDTLEVFNMPVSPRKILSESVESIRGLATQKNIALELTFSEAVPEIILVDSKKVQQIIVNLVGNAIKFTAQGGVYIEVDVVDKPNWQFKVRDTGIGIPPDARDYIFEPFHQVDNTDTRQHKGTGLGLSIVKRLVASMNGVITVESTLGEGSTFTVILPRVNIPEDTHPKA